MTTQPNLMNLICPDIVFHEHDFETGSSVQLYSMLTFIRIDPVVAFACTASNLAFFRLDTNIFTDIAPPCDCFAGQWSRWAFQNLESSVSSLSGLKQRIAME